jgi:hypothetical protein
LNEIELDVNKNNFLRKEGIIKRENEKVLRRQRPLRYCAFLPIIAENHTTYAEIEMKM